MSADDPSLLVTTAASGAAGGVTGQDSVAVGSPVPSGIAELVVDRCFAHAERMHEVGSLTDVSSILGETTIEKVRKLAQTQHAARGVAHTLALYKAFRPEQDTRRHKSEQVGGFSARSFDTDVTVPFLISKKLRPSVETHWLTQTFSFAGPFDAGSILRTNPGWIGPAFIDLVNLLEMDGSQDFASAMASVILYELIEIRNKSKFALTKSKGLTIDQVIALLRDYLLKKYESNAPRFTQVAIFALYQCLIQSASRYAGCEFNPLERMKSADRKVGAVGDIVVSRSGIPVEAVESKLGTPVSTRMVTNITEKVRTAAVERYLILSTAGVDKRDVDEIASLQRSLRAQNGCEIIVNGVLETVRYALRLLPSTTNFVVRYAECVEVDPDLLYQHRLAWNDLCTRLSQ